MTEREQKRALAALETILLVKEEKPEPWVIILKGEIRQNLKGKYLFSSRGAASTSLTAVCHQAHRNMFFCSSREQIQAIKKVALDSGLIQIMTLREFLALPEVKR